MKICPKCNITKSLDNFGTCLRLKDGKNTYCKECVRKFSKTTYSNRKSKKLKENKLWRQTNKHKYKEYKLKHRYGITLEIYEQMKLQQNGLCKICNRNKELVVDHCHKTGKVRGLLCGKCNKGLGHFFDNKNYLKQAINYLGENNGNKDELLSE